MQCSIITEYGIIKIPNTLYKYRSLSGDNREFTKNIITKRELWLSPAENLNDFLDCNPKPILTGSKIKIDLAKRRLLREIYPEMPKNLIKKAASIKSNSAFEEEMEYLVKSYRSNIGVCSLSEDPAVPKLWTDYADGHRGICLRFNDMNVDPQSRLSTTPHFGLAMQVIYQDNRPEIPIFGVDQGYEKLTAYVLTKTREWEYEAEWRLIDFHHTGNKPFPPACLSGVIFGKNTSEEDVNIVKNWLLEMNTEVELLKACEIDGIIKFAPLA